MGYIRGTVVKANPKLLKSAQNGLVESKQQIKARGFRGSDKRP